jgi:hypothetical protein
VKRRKSPYDLDMGSFRRLDNYRIIAVIFNLTLAFHWIGSVPFVEYFYLPEKGPNYESAQAFSQVGAPKPHVKFTVSPALVGARQH